MIRRAGLGLVLAAVAVLGAGTARAAELVLFELDGCAWCTKWHRDIGRLYGKTDEGALLPLRRVSLASPPPDLAAVSAVSVAPTFVVLDCGTEQGRIVGFNGEDQFWGDLAAIIDRLKTKGRPAARC